MLHSSFARTLPTASGTRRDAQRWLLLSFISLAAPTAVQAQTAKPAADWRGLVSKGTRLSILTDRITRCQAQRLLNVLTPRAERMLADSMAEARSLMATLKQAGAPASGGPLLASADQELGALLSASDGFRVDDKPGLGKLAIAADKAGASIDRLVTAYVQAIGQPTAAVLQNTAELQRLTQHLAVHYLLSRAGIEPAEQQKELDAGRRAFETLLQGLKQSPVRGARIDAAMPLIDGQWTFLRAALTQAGTDPAQLQNVVTTSERTLEVLTDLYAAYDAALRPT